MKKRKPLIIIKDRRRKPSRQRVQKVESESELQQLRHTAHSTRTKQKPLKTTISPPRPPPALSKTPKTPPASAIVVKDTVVPNNNQDNNNDSGQDDKGMYNTYNF